MSCNIITKRKETQMGKLNRLLLQKQHDEERQKNPPRPKLNTLHTVNEVKKWLPSIKRDIDFYLKQSEVTCYPETKIEEFSKKIDYLQREYRAFAIKLRTLEPSSDVLPWTERGYSTKKHRSNTDNTTLLQQEKRNTITRNLSDPLVLVSNHIETQPSVTHKFNCVPEKSLPQQKSEAIGVSEQKCEKYNENVAKNNSDTSTSDLKGTFSHSEKDSELSTGAVPWNEQTYALIHTPLLKDDQKYTSLYGYELPPSIVYNANTELQNAPLQFTNTDKYTPSSNQENISMCCNNKSCTEPLSRQDKRCELKGDGLWSYSPNQGKTTAEYLCVDNDKTATKQVLCIPYSDSSDSDNDANT